MSKLPKPLHQTGPNCEGCPFRETSLGYADPTGNQGGSILFLLEALGRQEMEQGSNAVGPTGGTLNRLLRKTPIQRSHHPMVNTVRCRPIEWEPCGDCAGYGFWESGESLLVTCSTCKGSGQVPMLNGRGTDYINAKPSPQQIRECGRRYNDEYISSLKNVDTIVALGSVPLRYMTGGSKAISKYRGTIFEAGEMKNCDTCRGSGVGEARKVKCQACKGKTYIWMDNHNLSPCPHHKTYTGKVKKKKYCMVCNAIWKIKHPDCFTCEGTGYVHKPAPDCKACQGSGKVPSDPDNPYVCERLKEGQLLFPTYHPAYLMRRPEHEVVVRRDIERIPFLRDELALEQSLEENYHSYPSVSQCNEYLEGQKLSIDIETNWSTDPDEGEITCIGFTNRIGGAVTLNPDDPRIQQALSVDSIVGQNYVQFDAWWLYKKGYGLPSRVWDTRVAGKLLNPDTPNDLTFLAAEFGQPPVRGYWKTAQNYKERKDKVAGFDVDVTMRVENGQREEFAKRGTLWQMEEWGIPLSMTTLRMRIDGMKINRERMKQVDKNITLDLAEGRSGLPDWGGSGTEHQHEKVRQYLYGTLELPVQKSRKNGRPTADRNALQKLKARLETGHKDVSHLEESKVDQALGFINSILHLRDLSKMQSSFLRYKLSGQNFVHPTLSLGGSEKKRAEWGGGTATSRFSCSNPNIQQVSNCKCKGSDGKPENCYGKNPECRGARYLFIPDHEDWEIMSADLKQAEVVGFLWYAQEWELLDKILRGGHDAHDVTAEATRLPRKDAKNTTFAILFGEAPYTTASRLNRPVEEIKDIRRQYFKALPGVNDHRNKVIKDTIRKGYTESCFGTRRYLWIDPAKPYGRAANQAVNAPIQNIPPMVMGRAMIRLDAELPKPARLWAQVHDEVLVCYPKSLREQVYDCMRTIVRTPVPEMPAPVLNMASGLRFNTDIEIGPNWAAIRPYDEYVELEKGGML